MVCRLAPTVLLSAMGAIHDTHVNTIIKAPAHLGCLFFDHFFGKAQVRIPLPVKSTELILKHFGIDTSYAIRLVECILDEIRTKSQYSVLAPKLKHEV